MRKDEEIFLNYFHMSTKSFDELADRLSDEINSKDTEMRLAISPHEMLAVTLR